MEKGQTPSGAVDEGPSYCLFQDPWWLDLVTEGDWDEARVMSGNVVAARLPFIRRRKYRLSILAQPMLTPYLGTCLRPLHGKPANQFSEQRRLMTELVAQLPRHDVFQQNLWPGITNWLPLYWAGFRQSTYYTNWLTDLRDTEALWKGFVDNTRWEIRKAQKQLRIVVDNDLDRLCDMVARTFSQQNMRQPYSRQFLFRVAEGALRRGNARLSFAEDERGNTHAVNFIVFDERSAHYLVGGSDNRYRNSGAASLLVWEAVRFAAEKSTLFDFEGSMVEPISRFFRGFNPAATGYSRIYRLGAKAQCLVGLRDAAAALAGRPAMRF
jgi:hypothetical protein